MTDDLPAWQRLRRWTGAELMTTTFMPLTWAVQRLIPEGLTLWVGAPKIGKSWGALDVALAVASGGRALGALPVEPGEVLYLALEDSPRRVADRMRALLGARDAGLDRLHVFTEWPRGVEAVRAAGEWAEAHPDRRLIIVDTYARVRPHASALNGNRSAYAVDTDTLEPWHQLATHYRVAVVMIHHTRKQEASDFLDAASGTYGLTGVADSTLVLTRARMESYGKLQLTGRDVEERELVLKRVGPAWIVHDGPMPDDALGDLSHRIVAEVSRHADGTTPAAVAQAIGEDRDNVKRYLHRLADSGRLLKHGRGLYKPLSPPSQVSPSHPHLSLVGDSRDVVGDSGDAWDRDIEGTDE